MHVGIIEEKDERKVMRRGINPGNKKIKKRRIRGLGRTEVNQYNEVSSYAPDRCLCIS